MVAQKIDDSTSGGQQSLKTAARVGGHISWQMAAFFLVTDMSIGGMVALPAAIIHAHLVPGMATLLLMSAICGCSAHWLGRCWQILLRRFPDEYGRKHCRKPYAEIGKRALGDKAKVLVSVCVDLTQFGAATVFLLLCANNTRALLLAHFHWDDVSLCWLLLCLGGLIWPATLLKSPNDFWPLLIGGMFCTVATFILICAGSLSDLLHKSDDQHEQLQTATMSSNLSLINQNSSISQNSSIFEQVNSNSNNSDDAFVLNKYLAALGTILFAYGGHPAIPTIQHDMKAPEEFPKSAALGFGTITAFNIVAVLLSALAYGPLRAQDSVVGSLRRPAWIGSAVLLLTTANSLLSIVLILNPLNQEAEELFRVPQGFGWHRVLLRSAILALVLLVAETAPSFGPLLDFFGASTAAMTSIVLPWLFHYLLSEKEAKWLDRQRESANLEQNGRQMAMPTFNGNSTEVGCMALKRRLRQLLYLVVIVFALFVGLFATLSSVRALTGAQFVRPCYLRLFSF